MLKNHIFQYIIEIVDNFVESCSQTDLSDVDKSEKLFLRRQK